MRSFLRIGIPVVTISIGFSLALARGQQDEPDYPVLTSTGLKGAVYFLSAASAHLPDFDRIKPRLKPVGAVYTNPMSVTFRNGTAGFPCIQHRFGWFAVDYKARIYIDNPGPYRFRLESYYGSKLYLDGQELINNDLGAGGGSSERSIVLSGGMHRLRLSFLQGSRYHLSLHLAVAAPGDKDVRPFDARNFSPPEEPGDLKYGRPSDFKETLDASAGHAERKDVPALIAMVRAALRQHTPDESLAKSLRKLTLSERLDSRTIEELESEGAGPETVDVMDGLRRASAYLPDAPPDPALQSPPIPTKEKLEEVFGQVSVNALRYTKKLPNFIGTEVVSRYTQPPDRGCPSVAPGRETRVAPPAIDWKPKDVLTVKLSFFEYHEKYDLILVNGKKAKSDYTSSGGAVSEGDFGTDLVEPFLPDTKTQFHWDHWTHLRKRLTYVFSYRTPPEHSRYKLVDVTHGEREAVIAGRHGFIYADAETFMVTRITGESDSIPSGFPVIAQSSAMDYGPADVGGRQYLLPLRVEQRIKTQARQFKNVAEFKDYRKFVGESTISFGDPEPGPANK
jgi:hypothetical protein